jgi:predicted SAM-dependent methyltransferase
MKLNLGCGKVKNEGYVNIDVDPAVNPDLVLNFANCELPYGPKSVEEVVILHTIEHVHRNYHPIVFGEVNRVLQMGGTLIVSYPDAAKTLPAALENKQGLRQSYWEMAILGRANTVWDMHRCLMFTEDFLAFLQEYGFGDFRVIEEVGQPHNAVVQAIKKFNTIERAALLRREVLQNAGI